MNKIFKIATAYLLSLCLGLTTVICCCVAPAIMAHFHKSTVACSHCSSQESSHKSPSNPTDSCRHYLTNAEVSHGKISIAAAPAAFIPAAFFDKHVVVSFLPSSIQAYPRGSPPLNLSFTPLYLRTFTLRI